MENGSFLYWTRYEGKLLTDLHSNMPLTVYGYETISAGNSDKRKISLPQHNSFWGFVQCGQIQIKTALVDWTIKVGQWFCVNDFSDSALTLSPGTKVFLVGYDNHQGLNSMGGPLEKKGRLKYIDNCTDTILYSPPLKGDPCLNFLHFPEHIDQTEHFHPSLRCGIVSSGRGVCIVEDQTYSLEAGTIFFIPADLVHKFCTNGESDLNVIAFHPDSDWGPTNEMHPMINRTWFDKKLNS